MLGRMFKRQTTGSVVCSSCGSLVGVNDATCYNCGRRNPGLWGFAPMFRALGNDLGFVTFVIGACTVLYVAGLLLTVMTGEDIMGRGNPLSMLSPAVNVQLAFGASGAVPVFGYGQWWTILSASWLHGSVLHILFNMLWVRQLGPATAEIYGPGRMVIIYVLSGAAGFALSSFAGAFLGFLPPPFTGSRMTVGASASIFGLLGALVYYGRRGGSSMIRSEALGYAATLFIMGFIFPGIDNYAHAGGYLGGYLVSMFLDPLKRERTDHLVFAVICIAASGLAVVASFLSWRFLLF